MSQGHGESADKAERVHSLAIRLLEGRSVDLVLTNENCSQQDIEVSIINAMDALLDIWEENLTAHGRAGILRATRHYQRLSKLIGEADLLG